MNWLPALGGVGGILAALGAVLVIGRGIFRQVSATEDNTEALKGLTARLDDLQDAVGGHETRLAVLEDRAGRRR